MEPDRHLDLPRGLHDVPPKRMDTYRALQQRWFDTCALAGYQPAAVPPLGFTTTFTAGHNAAGNKLYQFPDRRGRDLALVSDSLPAFLRLTQSRGLPSQRLSYCCPIFRYERRPRRHYHLLGMLEANNIPSTQSERTRSVSRLIATVAAFLTPLVPIHITITNPQLWHIAVGAQRSPGNDVDNILRATLPSERPRLLHDRGAGPAAVKLAEELAIDPTGHNLTDEPYRELAERTEAIAIAARARGVEAEVDLTDLHASEFHDGPAYLLRPIHEQRLLGDGGTYGRFARAFLPTTPDAFGAVVGLERLADLVTTPDARPAATIAVLTHSTPECLHHADRIVNHLRDRGISVWDGEISRPLHRHLRDVAELAIPYALVIGRREITGQDYAVRDASGALHNVEQGKLETWLRNRRTN
jgi:histidyl-tRNA synthetase